MAGGRGRRLRNPEKMLLKICGRPIMLILLDFLQKFFNRIIVVTSGDHRDLIKSLKNMYRIDIIVLSGIEYSRDICDIINIVRLRPLLVLPSDIIIRNPESFLQVLRRVQMLTDDREFDIVTLSYLDGTMLGISLVYSERCYYGRELSWIMLRVFDSDSILDIDTWEDYEKARRLIRCS